MAGSHGAQVVEVIDHKFLLSEKKLVDILMREDIRDLPVVVVSVAGAYRGGKSFLLNFFLRYLKSSQSAKDDGSWLGEDSESLEGFSWRSGSTRNTTGILMSEPIVCTLPAGHKAGDKVAVLLMDTQGTFDSSSTVNDCSTIFAVSTLLSSVQIYNISMNIQEDHLQHLHLFTEYGRLVRDEGNEKAFQVLQFLVRDWPYEWEFPYGYTGGEGLLQTRLQIKSGMSNELQGVRTHIRSIFERVSCFLMPHPGKRVTRPDFIGKTSDLDEDFIKYLKELVPSIFSPEKLEPKTINGNIVIARDLFTYFKSYMSVFSSNDIPPTASIMQVTIKAVLMTALREGLAEYEENMEQECGENTKCVPAIDIKVLHANNKALALKSFKNKKKMGSNKTAKPFYAMLSKDIDKKLKQFTSMNAVKHQKVTEAASKVYNDETQKYSNNGPFCVHPKELDVIHDRALKIAVEAFDAGRKRITNKTDPEKNKFEKRLEDEFRVLQANNDSNNKQSIAHLREIYWQHMENKTEADRLSNVDLQKAHDEGLEKVLELYKKNRSLANCYAEDAYKDQLIETLENRYNQIKMINNLANRKAINTALDVYNAHIALVWDQQNQSLHPEDLKHDHETANRLALESLHPDEKKINSNLLNEDNLALENILSQRYDELLERNTAMNTEAIRSAYNVYKNALELRIVPFFWWLIALPWFSILSLAMTLFNLYMQYYGASLERAKIEFYSKRRNKGPELTDIYLQELLKLIDEVRPTTSFCRELITRLRNNT